MCSGQQEAQDSPRETKATFANGELKDSQEAAYSQVRDLKDKYLPAKVNPAKILDGLKKTHANRVTEEMNDMANVYTDTLKHLDNAAKDINNWTASSMRASTVVLDNVGFDLQEQSAKLMGAISTVKLDI